MKWALVLLFIALAATSATAQDHRNFQGDWLGLTCTRSDRIAVWIQVRGDSAVFRGLVTPKVVNTNMSETSQAIYQTEGNDDGSVSHIHLYLNFDQPSAIAKLNLFVTIRAITDSIFAKNRKHSPYPPGRLIGEVTWGDNQGKSLPRQGIVFVKTDTANYGLKEFWDDNPEACKGN